MSSSSFFSVNDLVSNFYSLVPGTVPSAKDLHIINVSIIEVLYCFRNVNTSLGFQNDFGIFKM